MDHSQFKTNQSKTSLKSRRCQKVHILPERSTPQPHHHLQKLGNPSPEQWWSRELSACSSALLKHLKLTFQFHAFAFRCMAGDFQTTRKGGDNWLMGDGENNRGACRPCRRRFPQSPGLLRKDAESEAPVLGAAFLCAT